MIVNTTQEKTVVVAERRPAAAVPYEAPAKPSGPAAAAIVAAGIGCLALGLLIIFSEAIPPFKNALALNAGVGPLSGKTIFAVVAYFVSWAILGMLWRGKEVDFGKAFTATLILAGLGFLDTFPIVYDLFTAH